MAAPPCSSKRSRPGVSGPIGNVWERCGARPVSRPDRRSRSLGKMTTTRTRPSESSPTWWLVFTRELSQLWIGGKALNLTLIYTVLVGLYAYGMARDSTLSMTPPQEVVYEMLKAAMAASVFVGLIMGADSLSGERDRATLESLLLTPTSRRQIVVGKFLAALSPWPVALIISVPYWKL